MQKIGNEHKINDVIMTSESYHVTSSSCPYPHLHIMTDVTQEAIYVRWGGISGLGGGAALISTRVAVISQFYYHRFMLQCDRKRNDEISVKLRRNFKQLKIFFSNFSNNIISKQISIRSKPREIKIIENCFWDKYDRELSVHAHRLGDP